MAWLPQSYGGGTAVRPRRPNRPVYEDFQPGSETNEEEGARIVIIRVPGFVKEQLKIKTEHGNSIRVQGQRPLANYRWSRFNKLIPVPQNCDVNKIHAKLHNGVLTINLPKEVPQTARMPPKEEKPAEKTTPENIHKSVLPEASESRVVPPSSSEPTQKAVTVADQREQQKSQKQAKDARNVDAEQISQKTAFAENVEKGQEQTKDARNVDADQTSQKTAFAEMVEKGQEPTKDARNIDAEQISQKTAFAEYAEKGQEQTKDARNVDAEQTSQKTAFAEKIGKGQEQTKDARNVDAEQTSQKTAFAEKVEKGQEPTKDARNVDAEQTSQRTALAEKVEKGQEQTKDARNVDAEKTSQKTAFAEKVEKGQGKAPQTVASTTDGKDEKPRDEEKAWSLSPRKGITEPKRQKALEEETLAKQREIGDEKKVEASANPQKYTSEPKSKRVQEETPMNQRDNEAKKSANQRLKEPEKTKKVAERSLENKKEKENTQKGKQSLSDGEKAVGKFVSGALEEEKSKEDDGERRTNGNKLGIKYVVEATKQIVTGAVRKLNDDDRQMLINIGAAVIVIVAIGAYVSHRFVSSTKREN